ncbi:Uncharacterised protein [Chryseobacterium indologenes]|nr:Uncharacterised protein [Chryseobacterium indologenes]
MKYKYICKCFLISICVFLFVSCNNDNSNEETVKYIKTYTLSNLSGIQKSEVWNYNNKKQVVEIVRSNNTKTNYNYDNMGRLISAYTNLISQSDIVIGSYELEYEDHLIRITKITRDEFNNEKSSVDEYVLDNTNRPIKRTYYSNGGTEIKYTYENGNIVKLEGPVDFTTYKYDNKKNVLYHYPIGFRLIMSDGLNMINNNNIIYKKSFYELPLSLSYDSDGYLIQISDFEFTTQKFTY